MNELTKQAKLLLTDLWLTNQPEYYEDLCAVLNQIDKMESKCRKYEKAIEKFNIDISLRGEFVAYED